MYESTDIFSNYSRQEDCIRIPMFSNPRRDTVFILEKFSLYANTQSQILSDKFHRKFCDRVKNKRQKISGKCVGESSNFQNPELKKLQTLSIPTKYS